MSFLAPLFLFGAAALALPVIFHLIRRTTRERTEFSSLMFLQPSPPRLTRRSRLEHILLLILRCLALCLMAFGFARPFFRDAAARTPPVAGAKRTVVLVDVSASMRRAGLWNEARARIGGIVDQASPADRVAVFTFARQTTPLVTFAEWNATPPGARAALVRDRIAGITPGWSATYLDNALMSAAEALTEAEGDKEEFGPREVVLVSDLTEGSRLGALEGFEWPKGITLALAPLKAPATSNAGLQLVGDTSDSAHRPDATVRVRVSNAADSRKDQFRVGWTGADGNFVGAAADVYVPAGQSRIVALAAPTVTSKPDRIQLRGDEEDFDNTVFVTAPESSQSTVIYLGSEPATDSHQPLFFLERALAENRLQTNRVIAHRADESLPPQELGAASLVVVTEALPASQARALRESTLDGKTILCAPKTAAAGVSLAAVLGLPELKVEEAPPADYAMWAEINFEHPLFAPFADPRFSDFTKIHFWKHRQIATNALAGAQVVVRFDHGDPALIEIPTGKGRVMVLASGWQPEESQLALSSKFVPLLWSLLELARALPPPAATYQVGDTLTLPEPAAINASLRLPDGTTAALTAGATNFAAASIPGIYSLTGAPRPARFAVNVPAGESRTASLSADELERLGVTVSHADPVKPSVATQQKILQAAEAEAHQKLWRWLITATLVVLLAESALAGRATRQAASPAEATA